MLQSFANIHSMNLVAERSQSFGDGIEATQAISELWVFLYILNPNGQAL